MTAMNINSYNRLRRICKGVDRDDLICNSLPNSSQRFNSGPALGTIGGVSILSIFCCLYLGIPIAIAVGLGKGYTHQQTGSLWVDDMHADLIDDIY